MVEPPDNSIDRLSTNSLNRTGEGVIVDIGTGDGYFVYRSARQNPNRFYIGIDANPRPLEKISEKTHRKPSKGGTPNVLFLQAAVEDLPSELDGIADEVHVHFPWGSLLRAITLGDRTVLQNLRRICAAEALLEVVVGSDPERDRGEIDRLGIPPLSIEHIDSTLSPAFSRARFEITERGILPSKDWSCIQTSWARRLKSSPKRTVMFFIARAIDV